MAVRIDFHCGLLCPTPASMLLQRLLATDHTELMLEAQAVLAGRGNGGTRLVTFSPKVFLPLTRLCRDSCGYCTFAQPPRPGQRCYMTPDEVLDAALKGARAGCVEALFTLGTRALGTCRYLGTCMYLP